MVLQAIDEEQKLTVLGKQMSALPIDPKYSKMIMVSREHECTREIVSLVALLSVDSVFYTPHNRRDEAMEARRKFLVNASLFLHRDSRTDNRRSSNASQRA